MLDIQKDIYELSLWQDTLQTKETGIEPYYKEEKIAIIGKNENDSDVFAFNLKFTSDMKGTHQLVFTMNGKYYDPYTGEMEENPFLSYLTNEASLKLELTRPGMDKEIYDLVIKKCVEDSKNLQFTYTAEDKFIQELGKNGFRVELDTELENNQGTVTELAKTVLKDTDWEINEEESDVFVETMLDTMYEAKLNKNISVRPAGKISKGEDDDRYYVPDETLENEEIIGNGIEQLNQGQPIFLFYSDLIEQNPNPMIIINAGNRLIKNDNEDYYTNVYNLLYTDDNPSIIYNTEGELPIPNFIDPSSLKLHTAARGQKVVRQQKSGYDPNIDEYYLEYEKDIGEEAENDTIKTTRTYRGYEKTRYVSPELAQNYLVNAVNINGVDGWVGEGAPGETSSLEVTTCLSSPTEDGVSTISGENGMLLMKLSDQEMFIPDTEGEWFETSLAEDAADSKSKNKTTEMVFDSVQETRPLVKITLGEDIKVKIAGKQGNSYYRHDDGFKITDCIGYKEGQEGIIHEGTEVYIFGNTSGQDEYTLSNNNSTITFNDKSYVFICPNENDNFRKYTPYKIVNTDKYDSSEFFYKYRSINKLIPLNYQYHYTKDYEKDFVEYEDKNGRFGVFKNNDWFEDTNKKLQVYGVGGIAEKKTSNETTEYILSNFLTLEIQFEEEENKSININNYNTEIDYKADKIKEKLITYYYGKDTRLVKWSTNNEENSEELEKIKKNLLRLYLIARYPLPADDNEYIMKQIKDSDENINSFIEEINTQFVMERDQLNQPSLLSQITADKTSKSFQEFCELTGIKNTIPTNQEILDIIQDILDLIDYNQKRKYEWLIGVDVFGLKKKELANRLQNAISSYEQLIEQLQELDSGKYAGKEVINNRVSYLRSVFNSLLNFLNLKLVNETNNDDNTVQQDLSWYQYKKAEDGSYKKEGNEYILIEEEEEPYEGDRYEYVEFIYNDVFSNISNVPNLNNLSITDKIDLWQKANGFVDYLFYNWFKRDATTPETKYYLAYPKVGINYRVSTPKFYEASELKFGQDVIIEDVRPVNTNYSLTSDLITSEKLKNYYTRDVWINGKAPNGVFHYTIGEYYYYVLDILKKQIENLDWHGLSAVDYHILFEDSMDSIEDQSRASKVKEAIKMFYYTKLLNESDSTALVTSVIDYMNKTKVFWHLESNERQGFFECVHILIGFLRLSEWHRTEALLEQEFFSMRRRALQKRRVINEGVGGNRASIENFTKDEEYNLAISLGKYKEGKDINQNIVYGDYSTDYYEMVLDEEAGVNAYKIASETYELTQDSDIYVEDSEGAYQKVDGVYSLIEPGYNGTRYKLNLNVIDGLMVHAPRYVASETGDYFRCYEEEIVNPDTENEIKYYTEQYYKFDDYDVSNFGQSFVEDLEEYNENETYYYKFRKWHHFKYNYSYISTPNKNLGQYETINGNWSYFANNFNKKLLKRYKPLNLLVEIDGDKIDTTDSTSDEDGDIFLPISKFTNGLYGIKRYKRNYGQYKLEDPSTTPKFTLFKEGDYLTRLYIFKEDSNGSYVHIISESSEPITPKWYQFWVQKGNLYKNFREFDDEKDGKNGGVYKTNNCFKQYNRELDYTQNFTKWKDGHVGPWKDRYTRYNPQLVHIYEGCELSPDFVYYVRHVCDDGSDYYTPYQQYDYEFYNLAKYGEILNIGESSEIESNDLNYKYFLEDNSGNFVYCKYIDANNKESGLWKYGYYDQEAAIALVGNNPSIPNTSFMIMHRNGDNRNFFLGYYVEDNEYLVPVKYQGYNEEYATSLNNSELIIDKQYYKIKENDEIVPKIKEEVKNKDSVETVKYIKQDSVIKKYNQNASNTNNYFVIANNSRGQDQKIIELNQTLIKAFDDINTEQDLQKKEGKRKKFTEDLEKWFEENYKGKYIQYGPLYNVQQLNLNDNYNIHSRSLKVFNDINSDEYIALSTLEKDALIELIGEVNITPMLKYRLHGIEYYCDPGLIKTIRNQNSGTIKIIKQNGEELYYYQYKDKKYKEHCYHYFIRPSKDLEKNLKKVLNPIFRWGIYNTLTYNEKITLQFINYNYPKTYYGYQYPGTIFPVKCTERNFTNFEVEKDSNRILYCMLPQDPMENVAEYSCWVKHEAAGATDEGYFLISTADDGDLYAKWKIKEVIDNGYKLIPFLKQDLFNWNTDVPPVIGYQPHRIDGSMLEIGRKCYDTLFSKISLLGNETKIGDLINTNWPNSNNNPSPKENDQTEDRYIVLTNEQAAQLKDQGKDIYYCYKNTLASTKRHFTTSYERERDCYEDENGKFGYGKNNKWTIQDKKVLGRTIKGLVKVFDDTNLRKYKYVAPEQQETETEAEYTDSSIYTPSELVNKLTTIYSDDIKEETCQATLNLLSYLIHPYVHEINNYTEMYVPYDPIKHRAETRYYRRSSIKTPTENRDLCYYDGTYKLWKQRGEQVLTLTEETLRKNLKAAICEFDYKVSTFTLTPDLENSIIDFNFQDDSNISTFDILISEEEFDPKTGEVEIPAVYERFLCVRGVVKNNYPLQEDVYQKVGTVFYTDSEEEVVIPFLNGYLFKNYYYTSKNGQIINNFKQSQVDTDGDTNYINTLPAAGDKECNKIRNALRAYYGYDTWNKQKAILNNYNNSLADGEKITIDDRAVVASYFNKYFTDVNGLKKLETEKVDENTVEKFVKTEIPVLPTVAPDSTDLYITEYYIYDPEDNRSKTKATINYNYVGMFPLTDGGYRKKYDESCPKIRSIKQKEQNYLTLLQNINETFNCWAKYEYKHENNGECKYKEKTIWVNENNKNDVLFEEPMPYIYEHYLKVHRPQQVKEGQDQTYEDVYIKMDHKWKDTPVSMRPKEGDILVLEVSNDPPIVKRKSGDQLCGTYWGNFIVVEEQNVYGSLQLIKKNDGWSVSGTYSTYEKIGKEAHGNDYPIIIVKEPASGFCDIISTVDSSDLEITIVKHIDNINDFIPFIYNNETYYYYCYEDPQMTINKVYGIENSFYAQQRIHPEITSPENAAKYLLETYCDTIVINTKCAEELGTNNEIYEVNKTVNYICHYDKSNREFYFQREVDGETRTLFNISRWEDCYKYDIINETFYQPKYDTKTIKVPEKTVTFKRYIGKVQNGGFKRGINLDQIQRNIDSDKLTSKLIVKNANNDVAKDGFCSIQRAGLNPIKENFALNFDYFIQKGLLDYETVFKDLYWPNTEGHDIGYYVRLSQINKDLDMIANRMADMSITLDKIEAKYDTYSLLQQAAMEEITKLTLLLNEKYDINLEGEWIFNRAKLKKLIRSVWTEPQDVTYQKKDKQGNLETMFEYINTGEYNTIEIDQYNDQINKYLYEMDIFQANHKKYTDLMEKYKGYKDEYQAQIAFLIAKQKEMASQKERLNVLFYKKYYNYIKEGSWTSEKYLDDNVYYLDALGVLRTSAFPKVSYSWKVYDLSNLEGYEYLDFEIGDKTFVEDGEFFGYLDNGRPYQEEVIIAQVVRYLDEPSKNTFTVQNYKTQFEDLFQRIAAATQSLSLNNGAYQVAAAAFNGNGTINADVLQKSLEDVGFDLVQNQALSIDKVSIVTNDIANNFKLRLANGALSYAENGDDYKPVINHDGLIANLLTGSLDIDRVQIISSSHPNMTWDAAGITAYSQEGAIIDYTSFTRFDQYGFYGIKNYKRSDSDEGASASYTPANLMDLQEKAHFGLTWDSFFIKSGNENERVLISSNQDIRMSKKFAGAWQDRLIIGKITEDGEEYYGIEINDSTGKPTLRTDRNGGLTVSGTINAKDGYIGKVTIEDGGLYHIDEETLALMFSLDKYGKLTARNAEISGVLKTTVLEKDSIQSVGGTVLVRPSYKIERIELEEITNEQNEVVERNYRVVVNQDIGYLLQAQILPNSDSISNNDYTLYKIAFEKKVDEKFYYLVDKSERDQIIFEEVDIYQDGILLNWSQEKCVDNQGGLQFINNNYYYITTEELRPNGKYVLTRGWFDFTEEPYCVEIEYDNEMSQSWPHSRYIYKIIKYSENFPFDEYQDIDGELEIFMKTYYLDDEDTVLGLSINATENNDLNVPKKSFSIFEGKNVEGKLRAIPKLILGDLEGRLIDPSNLNSDPMTGYGLWGDNVYLKGHIEASSGKINGIQITTYYTDGEHYSPEPIDGYESVDCITSCYNEQTKDGFIITNKGKIIANDIKLSGDIHVTNGGSIGPLKVVNSNIQYLDNNNQPVFRVSSTGQLVARNAEITGTINATGGSIGPLVIDEEIGIYFNSEDSTDRTKDKFRIGLDGSLYATSANISGDIIAQKVKTINDNGQEENTLTKSILITKIGTGNFHNKDGTIRKDNDNKEIIFKYLYQYSDEIFLINTPAFNLKELVNNEIVLWITGRWNHFTERNIHFVTDANTQIEVNLKKHSDYNVLLLSVKKVNSLATIDDKRTISFQIWGYSIND